MSHIDIASELLSSFCVPVCPEGYSNAAFFGNDAKKRGRIDLNVERYLGGYPDVPSECMQPTAVAILDLVRDFSPREIDAMTPPSKSICPWMVASLILSGSKALTEEEYEVTVCGRSERSLAYNIFWVGGHTFFVLRRRGEYYISPGHDSGLPLFRSGNRLIFLSGAR